MSPARARQPAKATAAIHVRTAAAPSSSSALRADSRSDGVPRVFGLLQVTNSLGGALGAWIAGRIFDLTASYALALPIAAGMALLAPGLLWFVAPRRPNPPPLG